MTDYERIKKECFWDLNIEIEDIINIVKTGDFRRKLFLFEKILLNSTRLFLDLEIFDTKDLLELLESYKMPEFNKNYIAKRKNMAEVYFFDKPLVIDELKWTV